jgi:hypothetical protein
VRKRPFFTPCIAKRIRQNQADHSDVVYLDDWSRVLQKQAPADENEPGLWCVERADAFQAVHGDSALGLRA